MKPDSGSIVHHFSKRVLLISLLTAALLSVAGRTLISNLEYFKSEIEQELADYGITGVSLNAIQGSWRGLHPLLKIQGASLSIPGRSQALSINELELSVKLIPSLFSADLKLESFHTTIEKLILVRDKDGLWWLNDIPLTPQAGATKTRLDIHAFFQRLPDFVSVDIRLLQIRDLLNDTDYIIQNSSLNSIRKEQFLSLSLLARLPASLGSQFQLYLTGDAKKQQVYVTAKNLNMVQLLKLAGNLNTPVTRARMSLQSWIDLDKFTISKVLNKISLTQVLLKQDRSDQQSLNFSLRQKIRQAEESWRIDTFVDRIVKSGQELGGFESQILLDKNGLKPKLWVNALRIKELNALLTGVLKDEALVKMLKAMEPDAQIQNLIAELDLNNIQQSTVGLDFKNLKSKAYQSIPGLNELNGRLISSQGNSNLQIESSNLSVDFTDLFRSPLEFDEFSASISLSKTSDGLALDANSFRLSNEDIKMQGRLWLETTAGDIPFMSLRASYKEGKALSTGKYLPVSIMPDYLVKWVDQSILGGEIPAGGLLYHGRLQKPSILERDQSGVFHALFNLNDPQVKFLPDWPMARHGKGLASFHNNGMDLSFSQVQFASSEADQVDISIPNLMRAELILKANTKSSTSDLLDTLSAMPILDLFDTIKNKSQQASGLVSGQINLQIPLSSQINKKLSVKAKADLKKVGLSIPEWMIDFKKLDGILHIDNDRVSAESVEGLYYGEKSRLDISTDSRKRRTEFHLSGDLDSQKLLNLLPDYLKLPVSGKSPWKINASVAHKPTAQTPLLEIDASSMLQGTQLDLPQPATVKKNDQAEFEFNATLSDKNIFDFKAELKNRINGEGRVNLDDKSGNRLSSLYVKFGRLEKPKTDKDQSSDSQEAKEVNISGNINSLNMDGWTDYLNAYFPDDDDDSSSFLQQVQSVDLTIKQSTWGGQQLRDTKLSIENNGFLLLGNINSSLTRGSFKLPYKMGPENPLTADLDFIQLEKTWEENKNKPDLEDMPNLHINSKVVSYDDLLFSDLKLKTRNRSDKFIIEQLDFSRDEVHLRSSGHWQHDPKTDEHVSVFNIDIKGKKFGQTVSNLGLGETIKNGEIDFNGQIGWAGSLYDINWPTLIGEVQLKLVDGYLKNVDPGAGRFVGLLSLNALPKRLFLDFGDVVSEGMQFNKIKGRFSIKGEVMNTTNASMDGTSAKIKIRGSTNLREKTYDQSMIIIPKVGDTLPVIGTLAAGNTVGWGLLLLQKLFKKSIDKSVEIEYKVTGSWQDPVITLISGSKTDEPEKEPVNEVTK